MFLPQTNRRRLPVIEYQSPREELAIGHFASSSSRIKAALYGPWFWISRLQLNRPLHDSLPVPFILSEHITPNKKGGPKTALRLCVADRTKFF
ncbi:MULTISPECIES: hypothetical protein [unclassified Saccharibacter]|uniref:hypothetical protein n=1 Tax=unclassified Saccharibacter TaxID=2648722 RepID=UPI001325EAF5|nr:MULTISPECIES: hypothetical protein [unclassified Saccharibacter]MXV35812.1 hypothetical protein [Saccharibacter sp. EH611]MXV57933.1 hypothetical protein [Saccharibacter sp. EH70]MXV66328.1 hypothetical protein [Saccharibacter sp. EH60]